MLYFVLARLQIETIAICFPRSFIIMKYIFIATRFREQLQSQPIENINVLNSHKIHPSKWTLAFLGFCTVLPDGAAVSFWNTCDTRGSNQVRAPHLLSLVF